MVPLSSAEVQAFVISIRCAKCTAGAKSNGSIRRRTSLPRFPPSPVTLCLHLHYSADPPHPKKKPFEPLRRREPWFCPSRRKCYVAERRGVLKVGGAGALPWGVITVQGGKPIYLVVEERVVWSWVNTADQA